MRRAQGERERVEWSALSGGERATPAMRARVPAAWSRSRPGLASRGGFASLDLACEPQAVRGASSQAFGAEEVFMLRIYPVTLEIAREVARVIPTLNRVDSDLARQLRRAVGALTSSRCYPPPG